jgi:hypothetical protein
MEKIIERLRKEKEEAEKEYFQIGKKDGSQWAKCATFKELQYASQWETTEQALQQGSVVHSDLTRDEILGDYFQEIIDEDGVMGFEESGSSNLMPNDYFIAWESGWAEAVQEFWYKIREHL